MILSADTPVHDEYQADSPQMSAVVYETIGQLTSLMAHSPMHRHFTVNDITDLLMPPIILDQYRIYKAYNGTAVGFVAWGMLNPAAEAKLVKSKQVLEFAEWRSGEQPFVTDFIAPFGHAKTIVKDLKANIFANQIVKALRYESPGNPRRTVSKFYGANTLDAKTAGF